MQIRLTRPTRGRHRRYRNGRKRRGLYQLGRGRGQPRDGECAEQSFQLIVVSERPLADQFERCGWYGFQTSQKAALTLNCHARFVETCNEGSVSAEELVLELYCFDQPHDRLFKLADHVMLYAHGGVAEKAPDRVGSTEWQCRH